MVANKLAQAKKNVHIRRLQVFLQGFKGICRLSLLISAAAYAFAFFLFFFRLAFCVSGHVVEGMRYLPAPGVAVPLYKKSALPLLFWTHVPGRKNYLVELGLGEKMERIIRFKHGHWGMRHSWERKQSVKKEDESFSILAESGIQFR